MGVGAEIRNQAGLDALTPCVWQLGYLTVNSPVTTSLMRTLQIEKEEMHLRIILKQTVEVVKRELCLA